MVEVREACPEDAPSIEILLAQLGYDLSLETIRNHLVASKKSATDIVLVALEETRVIGVIDVHWISMLHQPKPVARITTLVISREDRGGGAGRLLVDRAAALARSAGCDLIELTTAVDRKDAQGFYEAMGFIPSSRRFHRSLS